MKKLLIAISALLIGGTSQAQTVTGSGTLNYLPKFTTTGSTIGNSLFFDNGTNTGIGTAAPVTKLNVVTNATNDGVRINNTGTAAATLGLFSSTGRSWALFSTGTANGTAGNFLIYDYSGGGTRMMIEGSTGEVGIGTSTPVAPLEVHAAFGTSSMAITSASGATSALYMGANSSHTTGGIAYVNNGTHRMDFTTNSAVRASIDNAGNMGIGTNAPGNRLHVSTNVANDGIRIQQTNLGASTLGLFSSGASGRDWSLYSTGVGNGWGAGNFLLYDNTSGNVRFFIQGSTGKVLIGDPGTINLNTTNTYKLYVDDGILTEKVRVAIASTAYWADYVFADDYKLPSLGEVEQFVKQNKHLPEVPSAEDVVCSGIDMAQMDATLLKKIEELTLYMIDQNKKIEAQQQEIEQLKKQVSEK